MKNRNGAGREVTSNLVVLAQQRSLGPPRLETWSHARSRSGAGAHTAKYITSKLNDQCQDLINRIRNGETNISWMLLKICIDLYIQQTNQQPANVERWDGLNTLRAYQKTRKPPKSQPRIHVPLYLRTWLEPDQNGNLIKLTLAQCRELVRFLEQPSVKSFVPSDYGLSTETVRK